MKNIIDSSKIKILICCHKSCELPKDDLFLPIQVGASISTNMLDIQRDDELNGLPCDNISKKNKSYCELTALYWAWKNIKTLYPDLEYIGINHYRRYFNFDHKNNLKSVFNIAESECKNYKINYKVLNKIINKNKTVIARKKIYPYSLETNYCVCHYSDDFRTFEKIILELHPEYLNAFNKVLKKNNSLAPYNMTVIRWNDFDKYCNWLFPILSEVEKRIDISHYNDLQKRIFGYISERLFNVWLQHNKLKIVEYPINFYTDIKQTSLLKQIISDIRNYLAFKIVCFK